MGWQYQGIIKQALERERVAHGTTQGDLAIFEIRLIYEFSKISKIIDTTTSTAEHITNPTGRHAGATYHHPLLCDVLMASKALTRLRISLLVCFLFPLSVHSFFVMYLFPLLFTMCITSYYHYYFIIVIIVIIIIVFLYTVATHTLLLSFYSLPSSLLRKG